MAHALAESEFKVGTASTASAQFVTGDEAAFYAIILLAPVLVHYYGATKPRRFSLEGDPFEAFDPHRRRCWIGADRRLGDASSRHLVETLATPGTRIAMASASLMLDPNPHGELDGFFSPAEVPQLLHTQVDILRAPVSRAIPSLWSVSALPCGRLNGWGPACFESFSNPAQPLTRRDLLLEAARSLVARIQRIRDADEPCSDDVPF
jgi:hypothetical protein